MRDSYFFCEHKQNWEKAKRKTGKQGNKGNGKKEGVLGMIFILDKYFFQIVF